MIHGVKVDAFSSLLHAVIVENIYQAKYYVLLFVAVGKRRKNILFIL